MVSFNQAISVSIHHLGSPAKLEAFLGCVIVYYKLTFSDHVLFCTLTNTCKQLSEKPRHETGICKSPLTTSNKL